MMENPALNPCVLCGGLCVLNCITDTETRAFQILCVECGANVQSSRIDLVRALWNQTLQKLPEASKRLHWSVSSVDGALRAQNNSNRFKISSIGKFYYIEHFYMTGKQTWITEDVGSAKQWCEARVSA